MQSHQDKTFQTQVLGISLILCKNPKTNLYLAVLQKNNTWWMPGGRVDAPEHFSQGARRQCLQEAGINAQIKGILRLQHSFSGKFLRSKIVFYAQPKDYDQQPKNFKDKESLGAKYMTLQQILQLKGKWRGPQLYNWASYVQKGGKILPLSVLTQQQLK